MATVNTTRYVILGLLSFGEKSGYDIKKEVSSHMDHFWSESYGQIYPMLRKLEQTNAVEKKVEHNEGKPDRYVYQITSKGQEDLLQWLKTDVTQLRGRNELLLRIYLGKNIGNKILVDHVRKAKLERQSELRTYEKTFEEQKSNKENFYIDLTLMHEIEQAKSFISWCDEALKLLAD